MISFEIFPSPLPVVCFLRVRKALFQLLASENRCFVCDTANLVSTFKHW